MQAAKRTSFEEIRIRRQRLPENRDFRYHRRMTKDLDEGGPVAETSGKAESANRDAGTRRHADVAAEQRKARAATKLRENLMRRKQQQRSRRLGLADETDGLPAAKSPDRDD